MKKLRIYLDTSVINFLFADDAPEKRDITRKFFTRHIAGYEAIVSALVLKEIHKTKDPAKRDQLAKSIQDYGLREIPLEPQGEITALADAYIGAGVIPERKYDDAVHIAVCTVNQIDVLVSWNFEHLANVNKERRVLELNHEKGYFYPLRITTPLEVMGHE